MSEANGGQQAEIHESDDKMESDNQFCLQWNDHKSTLVTVFESLLESGTLVDCSLAAEGQFLKAHKVVLSACSPYFELLFSEHKERHPILILKDVKFQELKALMDYMYRGEVNIPQDRLRALLETAESLQIKGLGDCKSGVESSKTRSKDDVSDIRATLPSTTSLSQSSHGGSEISQSMRVASPRTNIRKSSASPTPRKRVRQEENPARLLASDNFDQRSEISSRPCPPTRPSPQVDISAVSSPSVPVSSTLGSAASTTVSSIRREWTSRETEGSSSPLPSNVLSRGELQSGSHSKVKPEPVVEILLEPKTEYMEDMADEDTRENSVVLDDSDYMAEQRSGPSHTEEGSSNQGPGFAPWLSVAEWAADEVVPQQHMGTFRDPSGAVPPAGYPFVPVLGRCPRDRLIPGRKKKRCAFCPRSRDRKTTVYCVVCLRPICTSHRLDFDLCHECGVLGLEMKNKAITAPHGGRQLVDLNGF